MPVEITETDSGDVILGSGATRYFLGMDWPAEMSDLQCMLTYWKYWDIEPYCRGNVKDPHELFMRAMRMLVTPEEWIVSRWSEEHVYDWTHERFIVVWGAASSSKSWDFGLLTLMDFYADPQNTISRVATTTKPALLQRTFASVIHYHRLFKHKGYQMPGRLSKVMTAIVLEDDDSPTASTKAGIHGIAVREGPIEEAVAHIRGSHAKSVNLIADELSQMHPAIVSPDILANLRIGADKFRFVGLTNIDSFDDLAGRNSVPVGGWKTVSLETERWKTQRGVVRRHDGLRSPAIVEPDGARRYPHLLNRETLDEIVKAEGGNINAPSVYKMIRAWPPPQDTDPVVISETEAIKWGVTAGSDWRESFIPIAGLDPGFGGDRCILQIAKVGYELSGKLVIRFEDPIQIPIDAASPEPILYQIVTYGVTKLLDFGVAPENLAIDDSGPQSVADAYAKAFGLNLLRISFGGRPTVLPVSVYNKALGTEWYADRTTELAYTIREYAQYGQIRQFPELALREITKRRVLPKRPRRLEAKADFKKHTGLRSPDHMDACGLVCAIVRERLGVAPGASILRPGGERTVAGADPGKIQAINNIAVDPDNYLMDKRESYGVM